MGVRKNCTKSERRLKLMLVLVLAVAFLGGGFLTYQASKNSYLLERAAQNASCFVYDHLDVASYSLKNFSRSKDRADLFEAADAIEKVLSVCSALRESTIYHHPKEQADATIKIWGTFFLMKVYDYLCCSIESDLLEKNYETICLLSDTFQPTSETANHVTFMSLYWNFSHSELNNLPEWSFLVQYDDSNLRWPDF